MKILLLSDGISPEGKGGGEVVAWNAAKSLVTLGNDVYLITTSRNRDVKEFQERDGVKIYSIFSDYPEILRGYLSLYNPQTVGKVKRIIKLIKPEIVHSHNIHFYLSYHCLKISKKSGAKVFLTAHDVMLFHYSKLVEHINCKDLSCVPQPNYKISFRQQLKGFKIRYNPVRNIVIKRYLKYVDKIFAVSSALKEALGQNGIGNVEVIHNGVNLDEWVCGESDVIEFKKRFGLGSKKIVLFGGRLGVRKGGIQIVLAMKGVIERLPQATLLILGEKNVHTEKMLTATAQKNNINVQNIVFTGWIQGDELRAAYNASDLVVMPSVCFDTFGMVCLEAMASKKPVVATCFGGPSEIVVNEETGYIINPYDINHLADKIYDLLIDFQRAKKFGEAGYHRAKVKFDLIDKTREMMKWYEK